MTQIKLVQSLSLILMIWFFTSRYGAALAWLPAIISVQIICLYSIRNIFHNPLEDATRRMFAIFLVTVAGMGISYLAIHVPPNIPGRVIASLLATLVTGSILWFSDHRYSLGMMRNIAITFPQVASIFKMRNTEIS